MNANIYDGCEGLDDEGLGEDAKVRVPGRVARDVGEKVGEEGDFEDLVERDQP